MTFDRSALTINQLLIRVHLRSFAANPSGHSTKNSTSANFCSMCGPKYCSMKITEGIRAMAAEQPLEVSIQ